MDEREDPGDGEKLEERVEALTEELVDAIIDLEEYAQRGERPPLARGYRFKVNGLSFVWDKPIILGREVLEKAGLLPPANYTLRLKLTGEAPRRIELDELVDLRRLGVEKFRAIRKEQQEGEDQGRRVAPVLDQDRLFLEGYGLRWETIVDGSTWILMHDFPLPAGYQVNAATVAIRLEGGYPLAALDMMYVFPPLQRLDGRPIVRTDVIQPLDGKDFQRWSRHRTGSNPWVAGEDSVETHIYLIEEYFRAEFER